MSDEPRMTGPTIKVVSALLETFGGELSGASIGVQGKLPSGTLYPILARLERVGWLVSRWEDGDPRDLGRPRKRFYRLTGIGSTKARAALNELEPAFRRLSWA